MVPHFERLFPAISNELTAPEDRTVSHDVFILVLYFLSFDPRKVATLLVRIQ